MNKAVIKESINEVKLIQFSCVKMTRDSFQCDKIRSGVLIKFLSDDNEWNVLTSKTL